MSAVIRNPSPLATYGLLLGAALLAYANSFMGAFQFDDFKVIVDSKEVHSWQLWFDNLASGYRPLLKLTYLFNWTVGDSVLGFHAFNLALHSANAMLVYLLASEFGRLTKPDLIDGELPAWHRPALFAALLFAVHPVHTEAVTYVSGRSTALMTFFYLFSLWAYVTGVSSGRRRFRYLSMSLFMLAVLSKESAMLFPLALLVWEWACRTPWRVVVKRQWPYWLLFLLGGVLLLIHPKYWTLMSESVGLRSLHDSFLTQIYVSAEQIGKLTWPASLNIDPDIPVMREFYAIWPQFLLLSVMLGIAILMRGARPWLSLGIAWLVLHLLVLNTFFPRADIANERQLYWADWAILYALAMELDRGLSRRMAAAVLGMLLCVLAGLTLQRNAVYVSEVALWEDTVAKSPGKSRVWNNLGFAYQLDGRKDDAVRAYCVALHFNPSHVKAQNNLMRLDGMCDHQSGN